MAYSIRFLTRSAMLFAAAGVVCSPGRSWPAWRRPGTPTGRWSSTCPPLRRANASPSIAFTPIFVVHRTPEQIAAARADDDAPMPSPQADAERAKRPEWLVVEAKPENSYFWSAPYGTAYRGRYDGWFAPWGDQHYDLSGRLREGYRATRNLPVPDYYFLDDTLVVIE